YIAKWYKNEIHLINSGKKKTETNKTPSAPKKAIIYALLLLIFLVFARTWYQNAISNFYQFYAIETYGLTIAQAQIYIFTFLLAGAIGTFLGGPFADRFGKRNVILFSLLAPAPLAILLPFVNAWIAIILLCFIGLFLMSSFSVTVVYAQELVPGKIGTMSGLIVGLAFGMGAIGAVAIGSFIDFAGLTTTMILVSILPLLGILTFLLPSDEKVNQWYM